MIRYHFRPDELLGREACMTQQIAMSVVYSVYSQTIALENSVPVPSAGQCPDCVDSIIIITYYNII